MAGLTQGGSTKCTYYALHDRICAVAVTDDDANDSPALRQLRPFFPQGTGGDVPADSAYDNN